MRRFEILAESIAGRHVAVVSGEGAAYTDGATIHVPDGLAPERVLGVVVIHAALIGGGSLARDLMVGLSARPRARGDYLLLETARHRSRLGALMPAGVSGALAELGTAAVTASAQQSLAQAGRGGRRTPRSPDAWWGVIKPWAVLRGGADLEPATEGGLPLPWLIGPPGDQRDDDDASDEGAERSRLMNVLSLAVSALPSGRSGDESDRRPAVDGAPGAQLAIGGSLARRPGSDRAAIVPPPVRVFVPGGGSTSAYPEWDAERQRYRPAWCTVAELDPAESQAPVDLTDCVDRRLARQLAGVGRRLERHRHRETGDELDTEALISAAIDRATGHSGDDRVFQSRLPTASDLGVLIALDATGSTGQSNAGRRAFDEQRLAVAALAQTLDRLDVRVAVYGFYSAGGRTGVRFLRVKQFDDHGDLGVSRRLGSLEPGGYTRLGAAVRHGGAILERAAGTNQRLLVVVGDGAPYDDGYERRYAWEDSRRALNEAVAAGIGCACLSVGADTDPEVLEQVWGDVPHVRLERAADLPGVARSLIGEALRMAVAGGSVAV